MSLSLDEQFILNAGLASESAFFRENWMVLASFLVDARDTAYPLERYHPPGLSLTQNVQT